MLRSKYILNYNSNPLHTYDAIVKKGNKYIEQHFSGVIIDFYGNRRSQINCFGVQLYLP